MNLLTEIRDAVEAYRNQKPGQAYLYMTQLMMQAVLGAPIEIQERIAGDILAMTAQRGLRTPVLLYVYDQDGPVAQINDDLTVELVPL